MIPRDTIKKTGSTFAHLALSMAALSGGANSYYQTKRQGGSYTPAKEMVARLNAKPLSATAIQNIDWQKSFDPAVNQNTNGLELKKPQQARELIIVDGAVEDKSVIFRQAQPGVDIVEVPQGKDGMVELMKILSNYNNLDAVHIVSHAKSGAIQLGGQTIDQKELEEDVAGFAAINNAIREGGDLMLYGCDIAKGEEGDEFLEIIQNNTHVDVAASDDVTGNEAYGGNWELEIQKGDIEATPLPESIAMNDFTGTLQTQYAPSDFCSVNCAYSSPSHTSSDGHIFFDGSLDVYANTVYSEFYLDYSSPATYGFLQFSADGNNIASFELTQVNFTTYAGASCSSADVTGYLAGGGTVSDSFTLSGSGSVNLNNLNGQQITKFRVNASGCTQKIFYPLRVENFEVANKQAPSTNNHPTDITLATDTINQSITGTGAVVGGLSTTDADEGDTHIYSLVSNGASGNGSCGASGDDNNASFQVDNTNDDLETAGSLTAGSYNVCVETDDGTDSYQESFEITVNDDIAPSFENSTPAVSGTSNSQTTLTVRLDEIGTAYYVVVADGAGAPSSAQVKDGQDSGGSAASFSGSIIINSASQDFDDDITGLSSGTAYDIYVVAEDDEGTPNLQSNPTKVDVTTDGPDADGTLTAAGGVTEPVGIASTLDTSGEAIDIFDFTLSDGGSGDGLPMTVSQIVVNVSGTSTDTERDKVTWRLNGPDVSNVTGSYNAGSDVITFSGLSISIADGGNETYTLNAYYNDNSGLTEDHTFILSVDGDTDVTTGDSGTGMGSTTAVTNGSGSTIDIIASQLVFTTQPANSISGSALGSQPVVTAQDAFGNTDVDFTETVTLTEASAGSLSGDADIAAVSGVATFTDIAYTATADQESFTLTANDENGTGTDLPTIDANSVTSDVVATKLSFTTEPAPTSVQDGVATSFTTVPVVAAVDANNVVDTGYSTDITLAEVNGAGSATMSGTGDTDGNGATVSITPTSGISTFTDLQITYNVSGTNDENFNLQASSGGLTTTNSTQLTAIFDTAPTGYTVSWDDALINASEAATATFTVSNAEVGTTINYSVTSSGDGNTATVSGSESATSNTQQVTIDVSSLVNGTLTLEVSLTDDGGNTGGTVSDNSATLDQTAPSGYSASMDLLGESFINVINESIIEFSASGLEVGTTLNYSFTSDGGGAPVSGTETVTSTTEQFDNSGAGYDLSGLTDGTVTLTVSLTDDAGNTGSEATTTETKDAGPPSSYTVSWDDAFINASEATTATFTVSDAEIGSTINNSVSSSGDGNTATVSNPTTVTSNTQQVTIDVSALVDGTLNVEVSLTDDGGNTGGTVTDNSATLDQTAPSGYSVSIDQNPINAANDEAVSFTFAGAEVDATYEYTFSSSGGGTNVTGNGTVSTTTDQITGIDINGLSDGTITLSVNLTDEAGNTGSVATDTETKDTAVNSAPVLGNLDGDNVSLQPGEIKGIDNDNDATVTDADSPDLNAGFLEIVDKGGNNSVNGNFSVDGTNTTSGGDGTIAAGETIAIAGTSVGTIDATNDGQDGNTLTITFTSTNATPARIQTLIRNLRWGGASGSGAQTFTLTLNDNDGTANGGDEDTEVDFAMTLGNPPMVSHLNGDEVDFIEDGSPVLLDEGTQATLADADSPANYSGGNLTATVSSGAASAEDKLTLSTGGSVSLAGTTAGSNVSVNGNAIGTLDNNIAVGNDLRINFNSEATLPRVQELLRAIQYANSASPVAEESRQVQVTITDNEGLTSSASTITINTLLRPEASDSRILTENNKEYMFKPSDFGTTNSGYSIKIESLPAEGSLKLSDSNVSAGDEISIRSIENDLLTWSDNSDGYGYGYTNFDFKVIDDGDLESAESYTLSIDLGIRTVQLTGGKGWRFLSSPSSDNEYASIFNGVEVDLPPATYPSLYEMDQPTYRWEAIQSLSTSPERGEGFIFYGKLGEMPATLSFDGIWKDLSDTFEYSNLDYDGTGQSTNPDNFYLVGNPHPIALNFCEFDLSHVSEAITFWDPETGAGDYVSTSCDVEKRIEIAPFQSFWIRTTDVNPNASIPEEAYVNSSSDGYFKEKSSGDSDQPLITLNLTSEDNVFTNQLHILFSEDGEEGLDPIDAPKLSAEGLASEWLSFYSTDQNDKAYAIQALPYPSEDLQLHSEEQNQTVLEIPLNVETTEDGFFTLDWSLGDLAALDAEIYLKDNTTGNAIDLNSQQQYSFMLNPNVEKAKGRESLQVSESQPLAKFMETEQNVRFTLVVDYGAPDQNTVDIDLPEQFSLEQNYPNPFNPVTVIQFQLADQSNVELSVYDLTGRQVATLVNKPMQAGNHQVSFNAQDLSSGVYIYTLTAGAQVMSRKLTIVK